METKAKKNNILQNHSATNVIACVSQSTSQPENAETLFNNCSQATKTSRSNILPSYPKSLNTTQSMWLPRKPSDNTSKCKNKKIQNEERAWFTNAAPNARNDAALIQQKGKCNVLQVWHKRKETLHSLNHSLTYSSVHSLTYPLAHSLTHSPTHPLA